MNHSTTYSNIYSSSPVWIGEIIYGTILRTNKVYSDAIK